MLLCFFLFLSQWINYKLGVIICTLYLIKLALVVTLIILICIKVREFFLLLDINECSTVISNKCTQRCTNTVGGYSCGCFSGYTRYNDTHCAGMLLNDGHTISRNGLLVFISDLYAKKCLEIFGKLTIASFVVFVCLKISMNAVLA